jgi:hypothetical protein
MEQETIGAFARCALCPTFEVASTEPGTAIAFVVAAFTRHQFEAHGVKVARP